MHMKSTLYQEALQDKHAVKLEKTLIENEAKMNDFLPPLQ